MPLSPLRTGENASTSTACTTGGHCWHLTGSHAGGAKQRTARLGWQPVDAGTRGEEKDAQESVITRLLRQCKLASVPPPRALARVRQATFAWVASVTTSRVASGATCVQRRGAHPSERVPSRVPSLPPAFLRRPFRGRPPRAPPQRSPPPSCDACPAPAHLAQHGGAPCCGPLGRGRPSRGRRGSRGAQGSGGRGPEHAGLEAGRWRMLTRGAMGGLAFSPLREQQKSARGPPRYAGDCPCALSVAASRVRLDQNRLVRVCGAATGQSCIDGMLYRGVSRRQANFGGVPR